MEFTHLRWTPRSTVDSPCGKSNYFDRFRQLQSGGLEIESNIWEGSVVSNIQSISKLAQTLVYLGKPLQKPYYWLLGSTAGAERKLQLRPNWIFRVSNVVEAALKTKPDKRRPLAHLLQLAGPNVGASGTNSTEDVEHRDRHVAAVGNLNCLSLACPASVQFKSWF